MKISICSAILIITVVFFTSCQKEVDGGGIGGGGTTTGSNNFVRMQQGLDPNDDSVYIIKYDGQNNIIAVIDSIYQDTLSATYDGSGRVTAINEKNGTIFTNNSQFTYDANGLLTQVSFYFFGEHGKYVFEYTGGVVSKKSYYSDFGAGGTQNLYGYDAYTVTNGNITGVKEYIGTTLVGDAKLTYGTQTTPFKTISLFNLGNMLGAGDIMGIEVFLSKNIFTGYTVSTYSVALTYTLDTKQRLAKVTSHEKDTSDPTAEGLYTWQFAY